MMTSDAKRMVGRAAAARLFGCSGLLALLMGLWAGGAEAQSLSADIVMLRGDSPVRVGQLSARDGRVRIETIEFPDGFFLVDAAAARQTAYFVRPLARLYMDARQSSRLTQWFVPADPDAPCPQWQAMARLAAQGIGNGGEGEWRCEQTGEETIDGRNVVRFRVSTAAGQTYSGWIDREQKFPLRIKTGDGDVITLEHIQHEPPPASSFELPANYRKFSPEALIERIKQSDVWVPKPDGESPSRR
jgi:hypothetical protein